MARVAKWASVSDFDPAGNPETVAAMPPALQKRIEMAAGCRLRDEVYEQYRDGEESMAWRIPQRVWVIRTYLLVDERGREVEVKSDRLRSQTALQRSMVDAELMRWDIHDGLWPPARQVEAIRRRESEARRRAEEWKEHFRRRRVAARYNLRNSGSVITMEEDR